MHDKINSVDTIIELKVSSQSMSTREVYRGQSHNPILALEKCKSTKGDRNVLYVLLESLKLIKLEQRGIREPYEEISLTNLSEFEDL